MAVLPERSNEFAELIATASRLYSQGADQRWADAEWAAAQVLPLLAYEPYRREILEGAVCCNASRWSRRDA